MQKVLLTLLTVVLLTGFTLPAQADSEKENIILVIADGMGFPYITAYRYFKDGRGYTEQADIEPTVFDRHLVGAVSTYPGDDTLVTDSAASATALATGQKTFNGALGVDINEEPLMSVTDYANQMGYRTGAIATTRVTHATPAAFFAKVPSRRMEDEIADQMATPYDDGGWKFDLLVGSGTRHFVRPDDEEPVNHLTDLQDQGMRVVESYEELQAQQRLPLLGLFFEDSFPYVIDDEKRLKMMTEESLRILDNYDEPYVLMVEAAMIDWCGHGNDIACAMHEMAELEELMEFLEAYAEEQGNTTVILTADHSTGGLTLGADGEYHWRANLVQQIGRSLRTMSREMNDMPRVDWDDYLAEYLPFPLSSDHQQTLADFSSDASSTRQRELNDLLVEIVRYHTGTGWTTSGHTGEDVPIMAFGPRADYFRGHQDQTDIGNLLIEWVKSGELE